ncbi:MAG: bifunctional phosphoribosylaminoimidazolecarboxamide formyltransferase/IMP cyclohydrolase [Bacteroidetes bacterium]|nr:bifunctional phosphoribosylaminoimidazolecarboxamide formyltransferase/IMP cyclohydrolase [Bacteroidota bacterium]
MENARKIKRALISVFYKDNLEGIVRKLNDLGVEIISTGGTYDFIKNLGIPAITVESLTSYPSILGGRVKTLHPKVMGGILYRRDNEQDKVQIGEYDISGIDLVIVDLYPFEETVASGAKDEDIIEKIDIGGISLIRAAAKNYNDVVIVPSSKYYSDLFNLLNEKQGNSEISDRRYFAKQAFNVSSHYDTAIFNYFNKDQEEKCFKQSLGNGTVLRYGENPHQEGVFYGDINEMFEQLHGKALSYNNLLDVDAAMNLIADFSETTLAIIKHNNACGLACRPKLIDAWLDALAGDPISAFGGVIITNAIIDEKTAEEINKLFFEIIVAPGYENNALEILKVKKNRIILQSKSFDILPNRQFKSLLNGVIEQAKDTKVEDLSEMTVVTKLSPSEQEKIDLQFANILVKHTKSNAIVLAKNKQLFASGVGQTSRVDALRQAIAKANQFNFDLKGAVMASDAFFPFPDCVEIAKESGIKAVIQPGGSINDKDSISYCDNNNMAMVTTGFRHFKH